MPNYGLTLQKLTTLLDNMHDAVFSVENGLIVYANQPFSALVDYPLDEILQQPFTRFVFEEDLTRVVGFYRARLRGENAPHEYEFRLRSKQGAAIEVRINVGVSMAEDGARSSIGTLKDLRETKRTMRDLANSQRDIESILNNMPDVFYRTDLQGLVTLMSPSCQEVLGYAPAEMLGKPLANFYCAPSEREKILKALEAGKGRARHVEACLRHKNGSGVWISTNAYMRLDEQGQIIGVEGIARDISERKALEDKLTNFARIDDLTQVYNRRHFYEEADKLLVLAHRYQRPVAVLMLDLDRFKLINDRYGHRCGDEVLKNFAQACRETTRETDIIGRTGGEEFAILMPETNLDSALQLAERIRARAASSSLHLPEATLTYSVSIGVAVNDAELMHVQEFLSQADQALYVAKEAGRDRIQVYDAGTALAKPHRP